MTWNQQAVLDERAERAGVLQGLINGDTENIDLLRRIRFYAGILLVIAVIGREAYTGDIQEFLYEFSNKPI